MLRVAGFGVSEFQLCDRCKQLAQAAERSFEARTPRLYYRGDYDPDLAIELRRDQRVRVWRAGSRLCMISQSVMDMAEAIPDQGS